MKIKTLDIYGYGKWVNQTFEINKQIQLIYGRNETGKSTLQSFIKSILFGFPSRRRRVKQLNRYEPKHTDTYGGRILLTGTAYGDVWVERTDKHLLLTTVAGEELDSNVLNEILGGLDESLFDNFYAFNLNNLQELANIGADQLNDYFLSIGTLGSDKFISVAKELEKQTNNLYKQKGQNPPLNQLLNEYDNLAKQVDQAKENMDRYEELTERRENTVTIINETNQEIETINENIRSMDKLISRYDTYLKSQAAKKELKELIYTEISDNAPMVLKEAQKSNQTLEKDKLLIEERIKQASEELGTLTRYNWALNHLNERKIWLAKTEKIKETQTKIEQLKHRILETNEAMMQLAYRGQFYPEKIENTLDYEEKVENGLEIRAEIKELNAKIEAVRIERKMLLDQRKELQNRSANLRQQVAKFENQRVNEEEVLIQNTSLSDYLVGAILFIIGIVIIIFNLMSDYSTFGLLFWAGLLLAVVGVGALSTTFLRHRQIIHDYENSSILEEIKQLKEDEENNTERSRLLGTEINQREDNANVLENEKSQWEKKQSRWLTSIGFYPTADPEIILRANPVKQYFEEKEKRSKLEQELKELTALVTSWKDLIQPLLERFPLDDDSTRLLIRHVEETEASLVKDQLKGDQLNERIKQAKETLENNEEKYQANQSIIQDIFNEANVKDQLEFEQKLATNQRIDELEDKVELYKEQIEGYEADLQKIKNKQELNENYTELERNLSVLKSKLDPHLHERANLTVEINHLESDGTYQELTQRLENKQTELLELIEEWGSKRLAMEIIYQTLRKGLDNPVEEMNEIATKIFGTLSYHRYTQIKMNKRNIKVKQFSDVWFEPHELSQGTLEQLYVALRLAFVISARTMIKMPIIIDDAFVNFDEFRKSSVYQVLKEISQEIQIIFFTFDQQAKESFSEENIINLEEMEDNLSVNLAE